MLRGEEIPLDRRMSECRDDEWIEHPMTGGVAIYSPQYSDKEYVYRHIRLTSKLFRLARNLMAASGTGTLTIMQITHDLGIPMSVDWSMYAYHQRAKVLLFRRARRNGDGKA